jgi:hypothetical protein
MGESTVLQALEKFNPREKDTGITQGQLKSKIDDISYSQFTAAIRQLEEKGIILTSSAKGMSRGDKRVISWNTAKGREIATSGFPEEKQIILEQSGLPSRFRMSKAGGFEELQRRPTNIEPSTKEETYKEIVANTPRRGRPFKVGGTEEEQRAREQRRKWAQGRKERAFQKNLDLVYNQAEADMKEDEKEIETERKETTASPETDETKKDYIMHIPVDQAWQMRAAWSGPKSMDLKRTTKLIKGITSSIMRGKHYPIRTTLEYFNKGLLTDGRHRILAYEQLGYPTVPIDIISKNHEDAFDRYKKEMAEKRAHPPAPNIKQSYADYLAEKRELNLAKYGSFARELEEERRLARAGKSGEAEETEIQLPMVIPDQYKLLPAGIERKQKPKKDISPNDIAYNVQNYYGDPFNKYSSYDTPYTNQFGLNYIGGPTFKREPQ